MPPVVDIRLTCILAPPVCLCSENRIGAAGMATLAAALINLKKMHVLQLGGEMGE